MKRNRWYLIAALWTVSCLVVATLASAFTFAMCDGTQQNKLTELENLIQQKFVGDADVAAMEDAAAYAMVDALPDQWSYYVPKDQVRSYEEQKDNSYVGIGVTIIAQEEGLGFQVTKVEPGGSAHQAGIRPGDIMTEANGQKLGDMDIRETRNVIAGPEGTQVQIKVLRDGTPMTFDMTLKRIDVTIAADRMLDGNVGYITIANFNKNCAEQTIACVEKLLDEGAKTLIFDVRNNPGGYKHELVQVLDYLLPEGDIFKSVYTDGSTNVDTSDGQCLQIPMAVLMNGDSYSAAEFFAAALSEYDWAITVGQSTGGKGYFQSGFDLSDGSVAVLSVGKYFTPKGVCLEDAGGLKPDVPVEVDEETAALIYSQLLEAEEDPQLQAALTALTQ